MKALFVHGLGSDKNSTTGKNIKSILNEYNIDVITESFDLLNPTETMRRIRSYSNSVDYIIGTSLGGFYVLAETNSVSKIVINPCMLPSIEIPKLENVSDNLIAEWEKMEDDTYSSVDGEMRTVTFGAFGSNDELFSYKSEFMKIYGRKIKGFNNHVYLSAKHKMSYDELEYSLLVALEYFDNLIKPMTESRLLERYVNIFTRNEDDEELIQKWGERIYSMLNEAYKPIGGLLGCNSYEDLVHDSDMWKFEVKNNRILSVFIYSTRRGGRKLQYVTAEKDSSGKMSADGKKSLYRICEDDKKFIDRMFWGEVSEAIEHIYVNKIGITKVPAEMAQKLLKDKPFISIDFDGFHYTRKIGNEIVTKLMIGDTQVISDLIDD